ncbi:MAG: cobalamin-dependent protein [Acidobacteriota bacterium]|nr:cobalamin-dependent protein [Acidobacteriota bacterium]
MPTNDQFVAQLLEKSSPGYAGLSAGLLLQRLPEIEKRYEPDGFSAWKDQLLRWLLDLSGAVAIREPKLFEASMVWSRDAFISRQSPVDDLQAALTALRDILAERLPEDSAELVIPTVDQAITTIAKPAVMQASGTDSEGPGNLALSYLETILEGRPREAIEGVLKQVDDGISIRDAYLTVLIPALRETGRMWHAGELLIAEEHLITTTCRQAMTLLCERGRTSEKNDKAILLGCVAGNVHDIGIFAVADFFEMAGWRVINLGPDVPAVEIARSVQLFDIDVVLLSAALDAHLRPMQSTISEIRRFNERNVKILVGGAPFDRIAELWRSVGADGYSASVDDAVPLASKLLQT